MEELTNKDKISGGKVQVRGMTKEQKSSEERQIMNEEEKNRMELILLIRK